MKRPLNHCLIFALFLLTFPGIAAPLNAFPHATPAQSTSAQPTVDEILSKYVQALGGAEAYHKLKTRVMKGVIHITGTGEAGSIEVYEKAPNKGTSTTFIPGDSPATRGTNGTTGWYVDPDSGPQDVTGGDLEPLKRQFDFYREIRLKEIYPQMVFQGTATVNGRQAYVTEATLDDGRSLKYFFDSDTGLLIRRDLASPDGVQQSFLNDYQEVEGVQYPFEVRVADPELEIVIQYTEIRHNLPIEDLKFEKPAR